MVSLPAYGTTRTKRADVSYAEIERAASAILKGGTRPTVEGLRSALNGGSPRTLLDGLNRFWRDLGNRLGESGTTRELPATIADLAYGLWRQALALAADATTATDAAAAARLSALRTATDTREHAVSLREMELDQHLRSRERTVRELEEHLRATMSLVSKRDATIESLQSRLAAAMAETEDYRQRLAKVVSRAVSRHRASPTPAERGASRSTSPPSRRASRIARPRLRPAPSAPQHEQFKKAKKTSRARKAGRARR